MPHRLAKTILRASYVGTSLVARVCDRVSFGLFSTFYLYNFVAPDTRLLRYLSARNVNLRMAYRARRSFMVRSTGFLPLVLLFYAVLIWIVVQPQSESLIHHVETNIAFASVLAVSPAFQKNFRNPAESG